MVRFRLLTAGAQEQKRKKPSQRNAGKRPVDDRRVCCKYRCAARTPQLRYVTNTPFCAADNKSECRGKPGATSMSQAHEKTLMRITHAQEEGGAEAGSEQSERPGNRETTATRRQRRSETHIPTIQKTKNTPPANTMLHYMHRPPAPPRRQDRPLSPVLVTIQISKERPPMGHDHLGLAKKTGLGKAMN